MTGNRQRIWRRIICLALVTGSLLINIKNIFTSCQVDAEYQVTMAYRLLRGDAMFSEMWEAHQTSAFFLAFFEWIFLKITGRTTGIMIYANSVGFVCKTLVAAAVYDTLRRYTDKRAAFAALIFALNTYPKDVMLPDFANLQIWFALLLMCCLIRYIQEERLGWLVAGALCLCLEVLSYPSCVIVWLPCVLLIGRYGKRRKQDILLFTGICAVCGAAWLLWAMQGNPGRFAGYIYQIWSGDESHAVSIGERLSLIWGDFAALAGDMVRVAGMALLAMAAAWLSALRDKNAKIGIGGVIHRAFPWLVGIYILCYLVNLPAEDAGTKHHFFVLFLLVEAAALTRVRYLSEAQKRIFVTGWGVGCGGFLATLLLSDMGLFPTLPYMIPNICVCMPALMTAGQETAEKSCLRTGEHKEKALTDSKSDRSGHGSAGHCAAAVLLCGIMMLRNFIYINGWMEVPESFWEDSIFGVTWTAQYGPLKGIVNREGTYVADMTYLECKELLTPGDRVLVLSYPTLASSIYLYEDVEICVDSTISTPTYSERLLKYWEENPDKYPNVVIVKCYDGSVMAGADGPVLQWLTEEFDADRIEDGAFWRYYIKEN